MDFKRKPKLLFLDLETDSLDVNKAKIKFVGMMDELGKETILEWNPDSRKEVIDKINQYDKIITFNGTAYDCLILKNHGIEIPHWRHIDIYEVFKKRAPLIRSGGFKSYSLKSLVVEIGIKTDGKGTIDYHIFMKDDWTSEELKEIYTYLKQDLIITKELWDYLVEKFDNMKEFLNEKDQFNLKYITSSTGAYAYMMIANALGVKAEYTNDEGQIPYEGAYVMKPIYDMVKGNLLYLDFASLYPQMYVHSNLFSSDCKCCKDEEKWHGNDKFKIEGKYCSKQQGKIEELIKKFYLQRKEYKKKKDPKEFAIKITLNCFSEDTEILTETGVKKIKDCKIGEYVYSINKETGLTELKKINDVLIKQYDGEMYHFKDKNKDLIVTPDHHMLFRGPLKKGILNKIQEIEAKITSQRSGMYPDCKPIRGKIIGTIDMNQFIGKDYIHTIKLDNPYSQRKNNDLIYNRNRRMHISQKGIDKTLKGKWTIQGGMRDINIKRFLPIKELLYFIGISLSEGSLKKSTERFYDNGNHRGISHTLNIAQSKIKHPDIWNKIKKTLDILGFRYSTKKDVFCISSKFLYDFIGSMKRNSFDISLPSWIYKLDHSLLKYLHEGLYDGDGNKGQYRYSTVSKQLRDDMIRLNLHLGYRCYYSKENYITKIRKKANTIWRIHRTVIGWYRKWDKYGGEIIKNPTNKIVCLNVEDNHTVMAGREGKLVWTGQSLYGISAKPSFKHLYSQYTASDCTSLARQCIDYSIKSINAAGYEVIYADTDSAIVDLKNKPKEECLELAAKISKDISNSFPFPWNEFHFKLEDELKYIKFFKDKMGEIKKKNYIYINHHNKMTIKGLDIIKKNCSDLGLHIFEKHLRQQILEKMDCLFPKEYIDGLIKDSISKNKMIIAKMFNIKDHEEYASKTSIYNLIKEKYGTGEVKLIKNYVLGAGKGVKYCSVEEAEQLNIDDLDLDDVYKELSPFIIDFHKIMAEEKEKKKLLKKVKKLAPDQKKLFD